MSVRVYRRQPNYFLLSVLFVAIWLVGFVVIVGIAGELATGVSPPTRHDSIMIAGFGLAGILSLLWIDRLKQWEFWWAVAIVRGIFLLYLLYVVARSLIGLMS